jgi:sorting nexin-1/2
VNAYPGVFVPPPPDKHAIGSSDHSGLTIMAEFVLLGRFHDDFVENRRLQLQTMLRKITAHPMLYGDPDLKTFLESDSFNIDVRARNLIYLQCIKRGLGEREEKRKF